MRTGRPAAVERRPSQEALLDEFPSRHSYRDSIEMKDTTSAKAPVEIEEDIVFSTSNTTGSSASPGSPLADARGEAVQPYVEPLRLYKRRFFGLFQLVLLNVIVSWDVSDNICSATSSSCVLIHHLVAYLLGLLENMCSIL